MTTAGNLVFQGLGDGRLIAYRAEDGTKLWEFDTGLGISAPPITFETDGRQFIALPVGYGGGQAMVAGSLSAQHGWPYGVHPRRLLIFALDGKESLPTTPPPLQLTPVDDPSFVIDEQLAEKGAELWSETCAWCHGGGAVSGGGAPDLRVSGALFDLDTLRQVVVDGNKELRGMPKYPEFTDDDLKTIQHFVRKKARL
jgi:quinohemoprotein ethanol dehydrogenase